MDVKTLVPVRIPAPEVWVRLILIAWSESIKTPLSSISMKNAVLKQREVSYFSVNHDKQPIVRHEKHTVNAAN